MDKLEIKHNKWYNLKYHYKMYKIISLELNNLVLKIAVIKL